MSVVELEQDQITDFFLKILVVLKHSIIKNKQIFCFCFLQIYERVLSKKINFK